MQYLLYPGICLFGVGIKYQNKIELSYKLDACEKKKTFI